MKYSDFGGDSYIAHIYHNGGCYANGDNNSPPNTEVLLRYDYPSLPMHNKPSCWAYKRDENSGRLVVIGSHPEYVDTGEQLHLMKAILQYAMEGIGHKHIKDTLANDVIRVMDKSTSDNDPAHTKIGDRQYHHFLFQLPPGASKFCVSLNGEEDYHLNLYVKRGGFALAGSAEYSDTTFVPTKEIVVSTPIAGDWYIGVECATTVDTLHRAWGYEYTGKIGVLNGVQYSIKVSWPAVTGVNLSSNNPDGFALLQNYPNPFNPSTTINYRLSTSGNVKLIIYNLLGQKIKMLVNSFQNKGEHSAIWDATDENNNPVSSSMYFYRLEKGDQSLQKKMLLIR